MGEVIPLRVYTVLSYIPPSKLMGVTKWNEHEIPKFVLTNCPRCGLLIPLTFTPKKYDEILCVISGYGGCAACNQSSKIWLMEPADKGTKLRHLKKWQEVWISPPVRDPEGEAPSEVDDEDYRQIFREAYNTLSVSPRASAVLSRYALQRILRDKAGVPNGTFNSEINQALSKGDLPSHLTDRLYCCRDIGNLSAHPDEDAVTGELLSISPGEAEFLVETFRDFLDFYFVKPARLRQQQERVNELRQQAGMPATDWSTGKPDKSGRQIGGTP